MRDLYVLYWNTGLLKVIKILRKLNSAGAIFLEEGCSWVIETPIILKIKFLIIVLAVFKKISHLS
jgi:hypothetical protein